MPKAVMFDCYNTLLRYKSEEGRDGIWEMMKSAIEYMTERELSITPQDLADLYRKACIKEEQGVKLLLLSNAQTCFIDNELPKETRKLFDEVLISEEMGIKKPSEELFRIAFERLGIKPEEAVFVGDSAEDDMIPSGKLGCLCVMIGKSKRKDSSLSHVLHFNPYGRTGYAGFSKLIADLK